MLAIAHSSYWRKGIEMQATRLSGFLSNGAGIKSIAAERRALTIIFALLAVLGVDGRAQTASTAPPSQSEQPSLPSWLKAGTVRFARFDGGPIETQKALRSAWAAGFSPQDLEVLTNLYGAHGDRMIDLLVQARINFVWVTYSVGFS